MNAVWKKGAAAVLGAVMLLGALPGGAAAHAAPLGAVSNVLMIYQSPTVVTEHDAFTVFMELDNTSNIHQVYFTFCQITTPLCYLPIVMTPDGPHWFEGTTKPMSSYHGMAPGVRAGYNITVLFNDSTNITEPSLPNPFTNLTVTDTITGELVFEMTVGNPIYGLSGHVYDSATGAPLSRANVALTPGSNTTTTNASGAYAFSGLANGSYTLTVTKAGYTSADVAVTISGQNTVENVTLSNSTAPPDHNRNGTSGGVWGFLGTAVGLAVLAAVVAVAVIGALVALFTRSKSRRGGRASTAAPRSPEAPPSPPPGPR